MVKLNKKELERIKTAKIDDVNYGFDELGNKYIEVCCDGRVEKKPCNEEEKLSVIGRIKEQDKKAQDLALSLATLEFQTINYRLFKMFAIAGTAVSFLQNMPITDEYGTMCALGGTVAVMVPAVLETLTKEKIKKINSLKYPGVRRV